MKRLMDPALELDCSVPSAQRGIILLGVRPEGGSELSVEEVLSVEWLSPETERVRRPQEEELGTLLILNCTARSCSGTGNLFSSCSSVVRAAGSGWSSASLDARAHNLCGWPHATMAAAAAGLGLPESIRCTVCSMLVPSNGPAHSGAWQGLTETAYDGLPSSGVCAVVSRQACMSGAAHV